MAIMPPTSDFVMHGARDAMSGGLTHIEEQIKGIERAVIENPSLAFRPCQDRGRKRLPYDPQRPKPCIRQRR